MMHENTWLCIRYVAMYNLKTDVLTHILKKSVNES